MFNHWVVPRNCRCYSFLGNMGGSTNPVTQLTLPSPTELSELEQCRVEEIAQVSIWQQEDSTRVLSIHSLSNHCSTVPHIYHVAHSGCRITGNVKMKDPLNIYNTTSYSASKLSTTFTNGNNPKTEICYYTGALYKNCSLIYFTSTLPPSA